MFRTKPEAATVHSSGWAALTPGFEVTRLPLVDSTTPEPLLARLTYADAKVAAERLDGRLPTREEVLELVSVGHVIKPVTLSYGPEMVTRAHAERHDALMWERLAGWDRQQPVMNAGKHWIEGASGENVRICGWWDGKKMIQSGVAKNNPHHIGAARSHVDYATTTILVRPSCRGVDIDVPMVREAMALARRLFIGDEPVESAGAAVVRVALGYVGTKEATGRNDGEAVRRFFDGCTRIVNGQERPTGWVSGWDWCAAFASLCVHVGLALPVGAVAPVGRRIAVRELVEDARRSGRLRGRDYEPRPGDLYIGARGGGDPMRGGTGHVRVYVERVSATEYRGIGGNEGNVVRDARHRFDDATWRAWVAVT